MKKKDHEGKQGKKMNRDLERSGRLTGTAVAEGLRMWRMGGSQAWSSAEPCWRVVLLLTQDPQCLDGESDVSTRALQDHF